MSGLLECADCGSGYSMINQERMGCSAARNKGTCPNRRSIKRTDIEDRVLSGLKSRLMAPDLVHAFAQAYTEELNKARKSAAAHRAQMESDLAKTERQIANLVEAITEGMFHASMKEKMSSLEAHKADLEAQLSGTPDPDPILLHPRLADVYARKITNLIDTLNDPFLRSEATEILRSLIDKVVLHADADEPNNHAIELHGALAGILSLCSGDLDAPTRERRIAVSPQSKA
ncbi:zinc ribbon domain-containing protein, partial [Donghicola eburneus]|uniref:zinc ribbon domain-containing protein n=1 Tax=Donghicola eburneus TaxID=393278 RepID=UPI0015B40805